MGGAVHLGSTVTVSSAATFKNNVSVAGATDVAGNVSIGGTLFTTGNTTFDGYVSVSGNLDVGGAVHLGSTVSVGGTFLATGKAEFEDDVSVSGAVNIAGVVGIGTTSATNDATLTMKDTGSGNPVARISFDRAVTIAANGAKIGYTFAGDSADFEIANRDDGLIRLSTNDTERLRVESDGDVLVGGTANVWPEKFLSFQSTSEDKVGVGVYAGNTSYSETLVRAQSARSASDAFKFFEGRSSGGAIQHFVKGDGSAFFAGSIGAGTSSPSSSVDIDARNTGVIQIVKTDTVQLLASSGGSTLKNVSNNPLLFGTNNTERMRIDSSGRVNIGANSGTSVTGYQLKLESSGNVQQLLKAAANFNSTISFGDPDSSTAGQIIYAHNGDQLRFHVNGNSTQSMTIDSAGRLLMLKTVAGLANNGFETHQNDAGFIGTTSTSAGLYVNREDSDGTLVAFRQDNSNEGSIIVSGSTVTYNGGHLGRWSQAADGNRIDGLLKGTVMTNLDKMAVWTKEDGTVKNNEQLNCMAISSVEGDANVAGVFINWNEEELYDDPYGKSRVNDMNIAMTGDMVIRIASGMIVARGDLLMSAGDGTAKPQGDDIVRSKTIAKVISITKSHTYDDGSYLVPCVLMAC